MYGWTPNSSFTGEYISNPSKNPPQVLKHIGQDNIPEMKLDKLLNGNFD
jgi:hypothetical protein